VSALGAAEVTGPEAAALLAGVVTDSDLYHNTGADGIHPGAGVNAEPGLHKPVDDLSRGATMRDIVYPAASTATRAAS
jgi:hypothetical protein